MSPTSRPRSHNARFCEHVGPLCSLAVTVRDGAGKEGVEEPGRAPNGDVVVADRLADRYDSLQQSCREGVVADLLLDRGSTDKYVGEAAVIAEPVEQRFRLREQLSRPIELAQ